MIHAAVLLALCALGAGLLWRRHVAEARVALALVLVYVAWLYRRAR